MAGDSGMAGKVTLLLWAQTLGLAGAQTPQLLVEPPWRPAVLWDEVTLTCQGSATAGATTWYKDRWHWGPRGHNRVTVTESGTYECGRPGSGHRLPVRVSNEPVPCSGDIPEHPSEGDPRAGTGDPWSAGVTQWGVPVPSGVTGPLCPPDRLVLQVPARALLEGDTVTLRCRGWRDNKVTEVSFYHEGQELGRLPDGTELSLSPLELHHSGRYRCKGRLGWWEWKESAPVTVTVQVPVANATITPAPPAHQVCPGDPVTLRCSVQVGSAPVTFTWLHNGQEVARGPLLELGNVSVAHSGTYQCVATNQLGQDEHRALSPELALTVTPWGHRDAVAAGVGGALLLLVLLVGVIVAWHRWHRVAARKHQERAPPDPPEEGEVLYTQVVSSKQAQLSPRATTPQDPHVTYAELRGPHGRPQEPGDIYGNVL
ncbi:low affinity immunoglobulin gamma Fc region receptor II-a [Vidua chalybeata]|uniref:low affinity immunoglobulin gamma Fc region receptor II-a n=1 Tax=Vidua chalybeata TaxID=81927 RepID=UPI0023A81439|nr:low affinity immunoglobulin gamma Fc region receptor II-a [Vidua chalybeata]